MKRTARDRRWRVTVEITAYDTGLVQVDGVPMNDTTEALTVVERKTRELFNTAGIDT